MKDHYERGFAAISMFVIIIYIVISLLFFFAFAKKANAHSWYPENCCSGQDCAEVLSAETLSNGDLRVTSIHGTTVVPKGFPRLPSQDKNEHICMRAFHEGDGWQQTPRTPANMLVPICFFVPFGS